MPTKPLPRCSVCKRIHSPRCSTRDKSYAERQRRATAVAAWRAQHGDWCPGWQRDAHPSTDLTAEHPTPVSRGGSEYQELSVLCRVCNSAKGHSV